MSRFRTVCGILERQCRDCGKWKPHTTAHWSRSGDHGLRVDRCKPCHSANNARWQKDNREHFNALRRERALRKKYAKVGSHVPTRVRTHLRTIKRPPGIPSLATLLGA